MGNLKMPQINIMARAGRLCRDPELKYSANGKAIVKTAVACDKGFGDKKKTAFITLEVWGDYAERLHPQLYKGAPLFFSGEMDIHEYETKDGDKRTEVVCVANRVQVLEWRDDPMDSNAPPSPATPEREAQDDIPF
jgi:single-strand DNA-binding protein